MYTHHAGKMNPMFGVEMKLFKKQTTFCYCPICKLELVASGSFKTDADDGVLYKCIRCNCESLWYFDDLAPWVISYQHLKTKMESDKK